MQEYMEDEIMKDDEGITSPTAWNRLNLKSIHVQQGAFSLGKDFLLWGLGGICILAQPLWGQGVLNFLFISSSDGQLRGI